MDNRHPDDRRETVRPARPRPPLRAFLSATAIVALAAVTAPVLQRLQHANLSLLFMTGVLVVAVSYGLWPSIYASLLSFLVYNFFFTPPHLTLKVNEEGDVATLVFFLVMASLTGNLAARMRDAMTKREKASRRSTVLQDLTRKVAGAVTREQVIRMLADKFAGHFARHTVAFLRDQDGIRTISSADSGPIPRIDVGDLAAEHPHVAGWTALPIDTVRGRDGIIVIEQSSLTGEERDFADALIDQAAVALERTRLVAELEEAKLVSEREQSRAALLSSVSHDLRTPLSSIIGAASSLATYDASLSAADKSALLQSVVEEAERLDRHIQNLLDMTRLGRGELRLERDWEDMRDLLSAAARRLRLPEHDVRLEIDIADDAQIICVHGDLFEQVFVNLLDNAARHAPEPAIIRVSAVSEGEAIVIDVADDGPGIPEREREKVFDPFYRVRDDDRGSGAGLGLSICRSILRTHGGDITAHAGADGRGAILRIRLPIVRSQPAGYDDERT